MPTYMAASMRASQLPIACAQGIVFSVRPPKKSWKNIANLSGGEKTLSSLSLVFALHHYKPTPLYVMDEIDAALGERPFCKRSSHSARAADKHSRSTIDAVPPQESLHTPLDCLVLCIPWLQRADAVL